MDPEWLHVRDVASNEILMEALGNWNELKLDYSQTSKIRRRQQRSYGR